MDGWGLGGGGGLRVADGEGLGGGGHYGWTEIRGWWGIRSVRYSSCGGDYCGDG